MKKTILFLPLVLVSFPTMSKSMKSLDKDVNIVSNKILVSIQKKAKKLPFNFSSFPTKTKKIPYAFLNFKENKSVNFSAGVIKKRSNKPTFNMKQKMFFSSFSLEEPLVLIDNAGKIARQILMVDDNNNSLIPEYEKILEHGLEKLNCSSNAKKDVIVLGAGISGLLTGKLLQDAGYNVTILEANDNRVGGRIKTFHHEVGKKPPFVDPKLYAEAGAMRIPTTHPLVNRLIQKLELKTQRFHNVDIKKDNPEMHSNSTWICANSYQKRIHEYNEQKPSEEDSRSLGFPLPEKHKGKTAKKLLEEALLEVNEKINPTLPIDKQVEVWKNIIIEYDQRSMFDYLHKHYPERIIIDYIGTLQNLTSRLHLSFIHSFVDTFYINPETKYLEIVGGNYKLPYKLAETIGKEALVMNARAVEVQWASDEVPISIENKNMKAIHRNRPGVYVRTVGERVTEDNKLIGHSMDREFTADYLVSTIPFSSLRFLQTYPRLSYTNLNFG